MGSAAFIKVAFFDLGGTLVGNNRDWMPGAQKTLTHLRENSVRLGLISNTGELTRPAILNLLPTDFDLSLFDEELIIFSSEVHVAKPDPAIFQLAINQACLSPGECLFCTEELAHFVAAQQEGMFAIIVNKSPENYMGQLVTRLIEMGLLPA